MGAPHAYAPSIASFNRAYDSMSTGSSNAGPTLYMEPRPGTTITNIGNGSWTSQQGRTFCSSNNGSTFCY